MDVSILKDVYFNHLLVKQNKFEMNEISFSEFIDRISCKIVFLLLS